MKNLFRLIKRVLVSISLVIFVLLAGVFFFKDEIKKICLKNIDKVLNTEVYIQNAEISFFGNFPNISLEISNMRIKDANKSSSDSLLVLQKVYLGFDIKKLVQGIFVINTCKLNSGYVHIKKDSLGNTNYSIFKKSDSKDTAPFSLDIENIELADVEIQYIDQSIQNNHIIFAKNAESSLSYGEKETLIQIDGDFVCVQLGVGNEQYLQSKPFGLNSEFIYQTEEQKISLHSTKLALERAFFEIDGSLVLKGDKFWDVKISSPNTDIQSLISLLPQNISSGLQEYKSAGNLYFSGEIMGKQNATVSPLIAFDFGFKNASFYHSKIDQKIEKAQLTGKFTNGSAHRASTSILSLKNFSGYLGKDLIRGNVLISNFDDPYLDVDIKGIIDIEKALKLYPIKKIKKAVGTLDADINFKGKLSHLTDVTKSEFIKTSGKFVLDGLDFQLDSVGVDFKGFKGKFFFDKHDLGISKLVGKVGKSDFEVKGFFKNFVAYLLLDNEILKIQADFNSEYIDLNEILSKAMDQSNGTKTVSTNKKDKNYSFHLSPHLAYDLNCNIKQLEFRNLSGKFAGKNLIGTLQLRDQLLHYQNLSLDVANGKVQMDGVINASDTSTILIRNNTQIANINVKQALFILENLGQVFLTDQNIDGIMTANVETQMKFDSELHLDLKSISSIAEVKIVNGALKNFEPMEEMGVYLKKKAYAKYLKTNDFSNIKFSELHNTIYISNGVIEIPEMLIQSDLASDLTISGTHTFDNKIDYKVSFPLVNYDREERLEEKGVALDKQKRWHLYLTIKGTVDDYKIDLEENKSIKSAVIVAGERVKEVFKEEPVRPSSLEINTDGEMEMMIYEEF